MPRGNLDFRGTEISMSQRLLGHCADVNVLIVGLSVAPKRGPSL